MPLNTQNQQSALLNAIGTGLVAVTVFGLTTALGLEGSWLIDLLLVASSIASGVGDWGRAENEQGAQPSTALAKVVVAT